MRHLRSDYDSIQPWPVKRPHFVKNANGGITNLEASNDVDATMAENGYTPMISDDEPVFLLRAIDPVASALVDLWATLQENFGADPVLVERVHQWANDMTAYREAHAPGKNVSDVPDGFLR